MRIAIAFSLVGLMACSSKSPAGGGDDTPGPGSDAATDPADGTPAPLGCESRTAQPRDTEWTLTVGSITRTAKVHVPGLYDPHAATPLVINVHGRTTDATSQAMTSHAIAKSDAAGFIVIHPQAYGTPTSWNAGGGCCDPAYSSNTDDIGFMRALIAKAATELCIDPKRVYMMGLSNGGYLSHRAACEMGDQLAAIGSVAGPLSYTQCAPTRAVPVLHVHGTSDPIVPYQTAPSTIDFWTSNNACTTEATTYTHGVASCVTHGGCTAGADVEFCSITGGGHQWPGGEALPFLGTKSDDLIATDAIWDFFVAHPMP